MLSRDSYPIELAALFLTAIIASLDFRGQKSANVDDAFEYVSIFQYKIAELVNAGKL